MRKCYKCDTSSYLFRVGSELCGSCEEFETGIPQLSGYTIKDKEYDCTCKSVCQDCKLSRCGRCGNVNRRDKRVAASCRVCGRDNMLERIDGSDTDGRGNWVNYRGQVIGSCGECLDCGMKTVCLDCATARVSYQEFPPKSSNRW